VNSHDEAIIKWQKDGVNSAMNGHAANIPRSLFEDEEYPDQLTKLLIEDAEACDQCATSLAIDDFQPQPGMRWGKPRWVVADRALTFFAQHGRPIDKLIRSNALDYAKQLGLSKDQIQQILEYLKRLKAMDPPVAPAVLEKVLRWKQQIKQDTILDKLSEAQGAGELTPEKFDEIAAPLYDVKNVNDLGRRDANWPSPLEPEAFYGITGEFIHKVVSHTEGDPAALAIQFLTGVGNLFGPIPHSMVGETRHGTKLNVVIAGATSKGRKGTGLDLVRAPLKCVDLVWDSERRIEGINSGEGFIRASMPEDPDSDERRSLVIETEFARLLRSSGRSGSTISPLIRMAWDHGDLHNRTKQGSLHARGTHVSIIAHSTIEELNSILRENQGLELVNGFINRFLTVCSKRSKILPNPTTLSDRDRLTLGKALTGW
jgi:hypothetical protein